MGTVDRLVEGLLAEWIEDEPTLASAWGAPGHDDRLDDLSAAAFEHRERRARHWLDVFAAMPDEGLSPEEQIDRDLVLSHLRGSAVLADRPDWRRDPARYVECVLYGVAVLFQHRLRPEPELVDAACARLGQVPDALAHARRNLDPDLTPPLLVRRAMRVASGGQGYLRDDLPGQVGPALRSRLAEAAEPAVAAFADFEGWLGEFADRAGGDWRLGEAHYTALLREREMLGFDTAGLHERGRAAYAVLDEQMREVAARTPGGNADWMAVLERVADDHPPTPEAMLEEYRAATRRAREFVAGHGLVSFAEGEECIVLPATAFQRAVSAVALYATPPALAPSRTGHFYVPYPPAGADPEQVRQRLRFNGRASIPTVTAHEAYPGHHWQLSWSADNPRTVRRIIGSDYFVEGWGLYAEALMREYGFFADPREELGHLNLRILRAARIVVDTALHTGDMDVDEAVEFMCRSVALPREAACAEVERYCAGPTQAPSYLTGALEIERIRERWRERNPGTPLRVFHDRIAGSAGLPLGLAERVALYDG